MNKGISHISYNSLNLPISLVIANSLGSATNNYTYSADGKKLKVEMKFGNQTKTTDYVGNMIYENGVLKRILVDGGYVENGQYHFYIQDHLGNNRVVAKADGTMIQTNHYYPYGIAFMGDGTHGTKAQAYEYIDPDGRDNVISSVLSDEALKQLQSKMQNIIIQTYP